MTSILVFYKYLIDIALSNRQVNDIYTSIQKALDEVEHGFY